jgi:hypothetical protein
MVSRKIGGVARYPAPSSCPRRSATCVAIRHPDPISHLHLRARRPVSFGLTNLGLKDPTDRGCTGGTSPRNMAASGVWIDQVGPRMRGVVGGRQMLRDSGRPDGVRWAGTRAAASETVPFHVNPFHASGDCLRICDLASAPATTGSRFPKVCRRAPHGGGRGRQGDREGQAPVSYIRLMEKVSIESAQDA